MDDRSPKLSGEYLVAEGKITPVQLQKALEIQANSIVGGHMPLIGTVLVQMKAVEERDLVKTLERQAADRNELNPAEFPPESNASKHQS